MTAPVFQRGDIRRAMDLLHEKNLVFGDLRPPNILIKGDTALLVDFDWCGEEGKGKYMKLSRI